MTLQPWTEPLARLLADVTWRVRIARRASLPAGTSSRMASAPTLVYVRAGTITALELDARGQDAEHGVALRAGDLLVTCTAPELRALEDAVLVVAEVEPVGASAPLPPSVTVHGFAEVEPTIARLAADLGCPVDRAATPMRTDGIICAHIATTVLAAAIRAWAERGCAPADWLVRTRDPFVARAIEAMHADPGRAWSVRELAAHAAMSRSAFAERFRAIVGTPPLRYLAEVRMAAAKRHLAERDRTIAELAAQLGYASEEGFSRAFRRHVGAPPSAWRDRDATRPVAV